MNAGFAINRGVNISHWLSQSKARGARRREYFVREDVERIAGWGFDHLRLPVDEEQLWQEDGSRDPEAFALLENGLAWAREAGLRVVVDLHILRSHYFLDKDPALYRDPAEERRFAGLWEDLADALADHPYDQVAFELLNEAVAKDHEDWNRVAHTAHAAVRRRQPERFLVLGSNRFCQCVTFPHLRVPDDGRTLLTFHYYNPMLVTHYTASWTGPLGEYNGPVNYPGDLVPAEVFQAQRGELQETMRSHGIHFDQDAMRRDFAYPLAVREKTGLPLYCGEYGVYKACPDPVRIRWYRDILALFREYGIAHACWDYRGGFGIVDQHRQPTAILDVLRS
ncbi:MAG: cellulase family glycosylhydrolase [Opitutales bacterium]|nr:cellulase family glycosylhydrolase [Opitutales bacterium]